MLDKAKIAELEALLAKATPGPWKCGDGPLTYQRRIRALRDQGLDDVVSDIFSSADAALIAAMHEALPALLCLARAVADAPRGVVIAVTASDTIGKLETVVESGRSFPNGQTVILLRADAADTTAGEG